MSELKKWESRAIQLSHTDGFGLKRSFSVTAKPSTGSSKFPEIKGSIKF